jgi:AraC-like DNA-binding protein
MYMETDAFIGCFDFFTDYAVPWHRHRALQFNLVTRGRGTFVVGDRSYRLQPGTALWIYPNQDHILLDATRDFAMWFGYFTRPMLRRYCTTDASKPLTALRPPPEASRDLAPADTRKLEALFSEIMRNISDAARYQAALGYALLTAWEVHRAAQTPTRGTDIHPAVERAARLLREPEEQPLGLGALGRRCGLSGSRLSRLFHEQIGVTVPQFRNRARIDRFLQLFGGGHRYTLTEAAFAADFSTYSQFQRAFRQVMRISPAEYRRRATAAPARRG